MPDTYRFLVRGIVAAATTVAALWYFAGVASAATEKRTQPVAGINVQACVDLAAQRSKPAPGSCPAYLLDAVKAAAATCTEVGGKPAGISPASVWSLDVNDDGKPEYLYEIGANVGCEGAWSVFSCGSLGCPLSLVEERKGAWAGIGGIYADDPGEVRVLVGSTPPGYYDLKVGCIDGDPCTEYIYYQWNGQYYDSTYREVRGFRVDVAGSIHGLYALRAATDVLATPARDGKVLQRYEAGTDVAIIGQSGNYYYVSPCNACESGFVLKTAVNSSAAGQPPAQ